MKHHLLYSSFLNRIKMLKTQVVTDLQSVINLHEETIILFSGM